MAASVNASAPWLASVMPIGTASVMRLAEIVHVELVKNLGALDRHAGAGDDGVRDRGSDAQPPLEIRSIQSLEHEVHALHHVVLEIGNGAAERGSDSRQSRHQRAVQSNLTHEAQACSAPPPPNGMRMK